MSTQVQFLEKDGQREYAVVPIDDYRKLLALAEDAEDIRAADKAMRELETGEDELLPGYVVEQLCESGGGLRVWREYRGLTQDVLAESAGVGKSYISQIESGNKKGSVKVLAKIARVLNVDIDDLV